MQIDVHLSSRRVVRALFLFLAALLLFHLVVVVAHLVLHRPVAALTELFDMDREANLPALFNVLLFFLASALFYLLALGVDGARRRAKMVMALVFLFLGFDEGAQVHEKFMLITLRLMNGGTMGDGNMGLLYYAWIVPYGLVAALLLAWLLPWLLRMEPALRRGLLLSGALYVFGAIFMEALSGKLAEGLEATAPPDAELPWLPCFAYTPTTCFLYADARYVFLYTIEELAEMSGLILCAGALLRALERRAAEVRARFGER